MHAGPRHLLENRFAQLSSDLDALFAQSREQTRREFAEQLNQAVRRLRLSPDADEICATLSDSAAKFSDGVLLFRIQNGVALNPRIDVPLADAPAIASAADMQDPLVALATPAEVSASLVEMLGHDDAARVHLFPVAVGESVPALLYTWGAVQSPAIELLTQVAGAVWSTIPAPLPEPEPEPPAPELITIAAAPAPLPEPEAQPEHQAKAAITWEDLSPAEQQVHLRAQRFARVHVAEMRLQHPDAVKAGRTHRNLYDALRESIDAARTSFQGQFFSCPSMVDYLDLELTRTLAHDEPELLGQSYPGPLV
ncbi:MAG TPA: hypothetical protein VNV86_13890 [Candidatus Acidoferrum sp.]|nr:hypothetical protein [Candidatus Acidoferrum sp.]